MNIQRRLRYEPHIVDRQPRRAAVSHIRPLAIVCAMVLIGAAAPCHAGIMVVNFTGRVSGLITPTTVLQQYLGAGDTFSGHFAYDSDVAATEGRWPTSIGYSAVTDAKLTFTSGNSSGYSIDGIVPVRSDLLDISGDPLRTLLDMGNNGDFEGYSNIDNAFGRFVHADAEFRPGLTQHSLAYNFIDFSATMLNSASLGDWNVADMNSHLHGGSLLQENLLLFNDTTTGAIQVVDIDFVSFWPSEIDSTSETVSVTDASAQELLGGSSATGGADVLFDTDPASGGDFLITYSQPTSAHLNGSFLNSTGFDLGNFAAIGGDRYQLWDLDFAGSLGEGSNVTLHFGYDDLGMSELQEAALGIWHFGQYGPDGARQWKWLRDEIDTTNNVLTVTVDHFSPFALGQQSTSVVPEPTSMGLFGLGALCLGGVLRRRKQKQP